VRSITQASRADLLPDELRHPHARNLYYRLELDALQVRPEPIFSRRRRLIVFIPSIWRKFTTALERTTSCTAVRWKTASSNFNLIAMSKLADVSRCA